MMVNLLMMVIALVIFGYVIQPLASKNLKIASEKSQKFKALDDLLWQREQVLIGLNDMAFEFNLKKLSRSDYDEIVADFQAQLQQLDEKIGGLIKHKNFIAGLENEIRSQQSQLKKLSPHGQGN